MDKPENVNRCLVRCQCGCTVAVVEQWFDDPQISLALFHWNKCYSFRERLRYMWRILWRGEPYGDQVVLSHGDAVRMGEHLIRLAGENVTSSKQD